MRLFNLNISNLDAFRLAALNSEIEFPINTLTEYQITDWSDFKEKTIAVQQSYLTQKSTREIEAIPPFETHPYISRNNNLTDTHRTLILGTFPPPSYLHRLYPRYSNGNLFKGIDIDQSPPLYFFYGNRGSLWDIIGQELNINSITRYLNSSNIFISDIILFTQRISFTKGRAADSNYINIIPNIPLIEQLINGQNSIENIVFTSKQWNVTDGGGRGRRSNNNIPHTIQFTEENSAVSLFFRTLLNMGIEFGFQKLDSEETLQFAPANYHRIKNEFTDLFCFNLVINDKVYQLNLGDSPSGNAFTPFDSITFLKWIKNRFGDHGVQVVRNHPRNSITEQIKRERKAPIQRDLNYPNGEDICDDFLHEMYNMFLQRNFPLIQQLQNQVL